MKNSEKNRSTRLKTYFCLCAHYEYDVPAFCICSIRTKMLSDWNIQWGGYESIFLLQNAKKEIETI